MWVLVLALLAQGGAFPLTRGTSIGTSISRSTGTSIGTSTSTSGCFQGSHTRTTSTSFRSILGLGRAGPVLALALAEAEGAGADGTDTEAPASLADAEAPALADTAGTENTADTAAAAAAAAAVTTKTTKTAAAATTTAPAAAHTATHSLWTPHDPPSLRLLSPPALSLLHSELLNIWQYAEAILSRNRAQLGSFVDERGQWESMEEGERGLLSVKCE
eukprot:CAMPEP_0173342686 /NCGR_PEP_ID=MMETSP1144-20121109/10357_1 /TAXON_ID=483371 /ORGANISM="non described non described, Strain CCMP2298" /LENGTH=217 /DNA_ID=CAMNT_0014289331 /DNA_START=57 /DNA_END=707 /DNA_ORIENTATION=-